MDGLEESTRFYMDQAIAMSRLNEWKLIIQRQLANRQRRIRQDVATVGNHKYLHYDWSDFVTRRLCDVKRCAHLRHVQLQWGLGIKPSD